jgi:transcriptional regulator with XRE-family HTH domain
MGRAHKTIANWLAAATPEQARDLAKRAKTSVPHLRHIAHGRRGVSAELAQRLAHASSRAELPLDQTDLCDACHKCPLLLIQ